MHLEIFILSKINCMSELIENQFILGDNIWLVLGDGKLPVRSQEVRTTYQNAFPEKE